MFFPTFSKEHAGSTGGLAVLDNDFPFGEGSGEIQHIQLVACLALETMYRRGIHVRKHAVLDGFLSFLLVLLTDP